MVRLRRALQAGGMVDTPRLPAARVRARRTGGLPAERAYRPDTGDQTERPPSELPVAASATASASAKLAEKTADPQEFAAPLLQPFGENDDLGERGDSEKGASLSLT